MGTTVRRERNGPTLIVPDTIAAYNGARFLRLDFHGISTTRLGHYVVGLPACGLFVNRPACMVYSERFSAYLDRPGYV